MVFVRNLRSIHSLANVVILFAIKFANLVIILNQLLAFTRASATRIKTRDSGLPMVKHDKKMQIFPCDQKRLCRLADVRVTMKRY